MSTTGQIQALMSAVSLPQVAGAVAPEWIHLLPSGQDGLIQTDDKRGPYTAGNADEIIAASFAVHSRLPIDENHSTDLAAPKGGQAPARGWITEMQARADGIWGRVEWTSEGAQLVTSKAYRDISPVIFHDDTEAKQIRVIPRASLVNQPNLRGMASLHQKETEMGLRDQLIEMLGLGADASDADIMKGVTAKGNGDTKALQSSLGQVRTALGLAEDTSTEALVAAAQAAQAAAAADDGKDGLIKELSSSIKAVSTELAELKKGLNASGSEAFYQKALAEKRAGVGPASKGHLISLHQSDPAAAEAFVAAMPMLDQTGAHVLPPEAKDGVIALNASQKAAARAIGMSEADYTEQLKKEA